MPKVKELVEKIVKNVGEDKFENASTHLKRVITGKIRNRIDESKKKFYPKESK